MIESPCSKRVRGHKMWQAFKDRVMNMDEGMNMGESSVQIDKYLAEADPPATDPP